MDEIKSPSAKPLAALFVTLVLNMTLLAVCIICLAGQFTSIISWISIGNSEFSITVGREGWIAQQTDRNPISAMNRSPIGVTTYTWSKSTGQQTGLWQMVLADSHPDHLFPGVIRAAMPGFRLLAVRHWVVATAVGLSWCLWNFGVAAKRKREMVS